VRGEVLLRRRTTGERLEQAVGGLRLENRIDDFA
jgi:hypothetical protein